MSTRAVAHEFCSYHHVIPHPFTDDERRAIRDDAMLYMQGNDVKCYLSFDAVDDSNDIVAFTLRATVIEDVHIEQIVNIITYHTAEKVQRYTRVGVNYHKPRRSVVASTPLVRDDPAGNTAADGAADAAQPPSE